MGHTDAKFLETLRRLVDGRLLVLTASTPLPVGVRYSGRATLGNDRVAAAAGAAFMFPGESVLVVDAGTAVTIDVISREGEFLGGNIAPGMTLRFSSLHDATDRLPLVDADGEVLAFGGDTISAIRSGVVGGMVSEVVDAFQIAERLYGCRRVVLAGYDGQRLLPLLLRRGVEASFHANLVGFGLLSIFRHNLYHKVPNDIDIKSE
ncbi:MAG: type III pantothenate kinase [Muribaculaceae bacterium]|nr:type III pantothenate kinase [Muribaculaceae bacterium]